MKEVNFGVNSWIRFLHCYILIHTPQSQTALIYGNPAKCFFGMYVDPRTGKCYNVDGVTIIADRQVPLIPRSNFKIVRI